MDITQLQRSGPWRFDQLEGLPDDGRRYEVVDRLLVVSRPPSPWHEVVGAADRLPAGRRGVPTGRRRGRRRGRSGALGPVVVDLDGIRRISS